jgi:hypothetical protein
MTSAGTLSDAFLQPVASVELAFCRFMLVTQTAEFNGGP